MRQPSLMAATAALSVTALFFSLGGAGLAANGGAFILGVFNSATQLTALVANFNGSALQVSNTSAAASAVPLQLTAAAGHPPMKVNTTTKVVNLNADYVDGLNASAQLTRVMRIPFNLAAGAVSAPITVPANVPVQLIGVTLTSSPAGVGQASLLRIPGSLIEWNGLESPSCCTSGAFMQGVSSTLGDLIVHIDYDHDVVVVVASADTIRIENRGSLLRGPEA